MTNFGEVNPQVEFAWEFARKHFGPDVRVVRGDFGLGVCWCAYVPSADPGTKEFLGPIPLDLLIDTMTGRAEKRIPKILFVEDQGL